MAIERQIHEHDGPSGHYESVFVHDPAAGSQPGVLYLPTFFGVTEADVEKAAEMAERGYKVLVVDFYGKGRRPTNQEEAFAHHTEFTADRAQMRDTLLASLAVLKALPGVDAARIGSVGFCLGGMAVLDLARAGADMKAGVCVHGVFDPPPYPSAKIVSKLLITHGWNDPWCPPEATVGLAKELTDAGCDWQILAMGHVGHAFTAKNVPMDEKREFGYHPDADARSWNATYDLFDEVF